MGSSSQTSNFGLSKFTSVDRPTWMADYNKDMEAIDQKAVCKDTEGNITVGSIHATDGVIHLNPARTALIHSPDSQKMGIFANEVEVGRGIFYGVDQDSWLVAPMKDPHDDDENSGLDLGQPSRRWKDIYAVNPVINTSDRKEKQDIQPLNDELVVAFVDGLQACSYQWIKNESGRTHVGFIAQDVEALMERLGMTSLDFAGFIKSPKTDMVFPDKKQDTNTVNEDGALLAGTLQMPVTRKVPGEYTYGLRYEEFIPILWRYSQIMKANLSERLAQLEQQIADIKTR